MITPFDYSSQVDEKVLQQLSEFAISGGVNGLFLCGSAGQGPVMTIEQRKLVAETVINVTRSRVPVIVMVGTSDVETTIKLALHSEEKGAAAIAIVPPYYYTDHSEFEVVAHIRKAALATRLPVFLYNNPEYTGTNLDPILVRKILEVAPNVIGIKLAWGTAEMVSHYRDMLPDDFIIFSGTISSLYPGFYLGANGTINPPTTFFPELCASFWKSLQVNDGERIMGYYKQLACISKAVEKNRNKMRSALRELARIRGFDVKKYPKWDTEPLSEDEILELRNSIDRAGLKIVAHV